jgi:hypothetical protein
MVLTAYGALSPVIGLVVTVTAQYEVLSRLDAGVEASGPHAFAVCEPWPSSVGMARVHRIPAQRLVTIAKRPFSGPGRREQVPVICPSG